VHQNWARTKFVEWWEARSNDPVPETAQQAVDIADGGGLAMPKRITVRQVAGERFDRIIGYELGEIPEGVETAEYEIDDIPF